MNIDELSENIVYSEIFNKINTRNKVLDELISLEKLVEEKKRILENLDTDFQELNIDLNLYKSFFEKYDIVRKYGFNVETIYRVNEIKILRDNNLNKWYEVYYDCIESDDKPFDKPFYKNDLNMNLKKFMHLLDYSNTELKERK